MFCKHDSNKRTRATGGTSGKVLFSPALQLDGEEDKEKNTADNEYESDEEYFLQDENEFNPYLFIGGLPPHASVVVRGKVCLPASSSVHRQTLTLDLDETLVHCSIEQIPNPDIVFPVSFNGASYQVYVRKRPFLDSFLQAVSKHFEIVVFTASQKVYADKLLDLIGLSILSIYFLVNVHYMNSHDIFNLKNRSGQRIYSA